MKEDLKAFVLIPVCLTLLGYAYGITLCWLFGKPLFEYLPIISLVGTWALIIGSIHFYFLHIDKPKKKKMR